MYRALANLNVGKGVMIKKGQAFSKRRMSPVIAEQLLLAEKLAEVNAPPIATIPLIRDYSRRLSKVSVKNADTFVDTDPQELAGVMKLDVDRVIKLQEEICRMLDAPDPNSNG